MLFVKMNELTLFILSVVMETADVLMTDLQG